LRGCDRAERPAWGGRPAADARPPTPALTGRESTSLAHWAPRERPRHEGAGHEDPVPGTARRERLDSSVGLRPPPGGACLHRLSGGWCDARESPLSSGRVTTEERLPPCVVYGIVGTKVTRCQHRGSQPRTSPAARPKLDMTRLKSIDNGWRNHLY